MRERRFKWSDLADCLINLGDWEDPDNACYANKDLVREVSAEVYE
jgi:hypothetical protein